METQKPTKTMEEIVAELDRDTLNRIVCRHAENDEDFSWMILKAAMSRNEVYDEIKNEMASIRKSKRFYDWYSSGELYSQLRNILEAIELNITDSEQGVDLIHRFLLLDKAVCGRCDDSDGGLGEIFNYEAVDLLKKFASSYSDKEKLEQIVYKLIETNDFGCHDGILNEIADILPEKNIRSLMTKDFSRDRNYIKPQMAFALKDAPLFEKLLTETRPNGFGNRDLIELSKCWIACGDLGKALEYALKIDHSDSYKKEVILEEIYTKNGDSEALKDLYSKSFMRSPHDDTKDKIIKNFGEDFFSTLVEQRIEDVEKSEYFYQNEVVFLLKYKGAEAAEKYLFARRKKLEQEYFQSDFIKMVKKEFSPLVRTIVLRVPLNYYLESANTKYYPAAAKHLKYLTEIAPLITDWRDVQPHNEFMEVIIAKHYRKKSFWRYFE
ncbi:hypothetical protein J6Z19_07280 [bacterium]|nr:hypothetical protein [bacterium]